MQKAPVMKGSGLKPLEESQQSEEVHVFGRNLEERVVTKDEEELTSISFSGTQNNQRPEEDDIESIRKRKFDAITGEEDEETIFQGDFKLFVWDLTTSNWIEKGRGQLKLNDSINQHERRSRLIMRVGGTLRIILNVAIKRSFFRVIANSKTNIRFTDSQTVWAASGSNAHQLKDLIDERLKLSAEEEKAIKKKNKSADDESGPSKKTKGDQTPEGETPETSKGEDKEDSTTQKDSRTEKTEIICTDTAKSESNETGPHSSGESDSGESSQEESNKIQEPDGEQDKNSTEKVESRPNGDRDSSGSEDR